MTPSKGCVTLEEALLYQMVKHVGSWKGRTVVVRWCLIPNPKPKFAHCGNVLVYGSHKLVTLCTGVSIGCHSDNKILYACLV